MQEFAQHTKIQLMKFNPCHVPRDLEYVDLGSTVGWQVNNGAGYVAGTTVIAIDAPNIAPVAGSVVKFAGHDWAYKVASGTTTSVTLSDGLKQAVIDNEIITVYTVYDVTEHLKAVSDYEIVINPTTSDIILDAQIDFVFSNLEVQQGLAAETYPFYLRDTFKPYHKFGLPYFSTLISDDWWVRIALLNVADWETFYVGKVVKDSVDVRYPDLDVVFFTESPLYDWRDGVIADVKDIYDGHAFTDSDNPTPTISGDIKTIIRKVLASVGTDTANVNFDSDTDYFDHTHQGTAYDFSDVWWINELWTDEEFSSATSWNWLKEQCIRWNAVVVLNFESNVPKLYFRSKTNSSAAIDTLVADDLLERAVISPQWKDKLEIENSVLVGSATQYWNGPSRTSYYSYNGGKDDPIQHIQAVPLAGGNVVQIRADQLDVKDRFRIAEDEAWRTVTLKHPSGYVLVKPSLKRSYKSGSAIVKKDDKIIDIEHTQSVKLKLAYPDVYVVGYDGVPFLLYNNGGGIGSYTKQALSYDPESGAGEAGIAIVDMMPIAFVGDEVQVGKTLIYTDVSGSISDLNYTRVELKTDRRLKEIDDSGSHGIAAGYVLAKIEDDKYAEWKLMMYIPRSSNPYKGFIDVFNVGMYDQGDQGVNDGSGFWWLNFGFSKLEIVDSELYLGSATLGGDQINSCFLNWHTLNPNKDDGLYFTSDASDGYLEKRDIETYVSSPVFSSGTPPAGSRWHGMHVTALNADVQSYWLTDTSNKIIVSGYGTSYASLNTLVGGGASPYPAKGSSEVPLDLSLSNPIGVWKCYDDLVVFTDYDAGVVCLLDQGGECWTIEDTIDNPSQVCAEDFTAYYKMSTPEVNGYKYMVDFNANTAKLLWNFISVDRRVVKCMVHKDTMTTKPKPLDRLILNEDVIAPISVTTGTYAWIIGMTYNFERREYGFKLLEDQAA